MGRSITRLRPGTEVRYFGHTCDVQDVYPHIAYLWDVVEQERICVCLGDLVMAGVEPSSPPPANFYY